MLRELHKELGIPDDYGVDGTRPEFEEATELVEVGPNLVGRMQHLTPQAAARWAEAHPAGRRGMRFSGKSELTSEFPVLGSDEPLTISFWFRTPDIVTRTTVLEQILEI